MGGAALLEIKSLSARYAGADTDILQEIDLTLSQGQITCVIGESGCGKSTLLNAILRLPGRVDIRGGSVCFRGQDMRQLGKKELRRIRGSGIGVVFQEPGASLDPIRKIHAQFYEAMSAHQSITRAQAREKAASILESLEFSDTQRILDSCPAQLSGGMNQRVAIALAMALEPDILLADEPTSALDVTVQAQIVQELLSLRQRYGTCILMITHNMGVVAKMAEMVAVMYAGRIVEYGSREQVLYSPAHPYTRALLAAIPRLSGEPPKGIPGKKPDVFPAVGCAFAPRCGCAAVGCAAAQLHRVNFGDGHWTLCQEVSACEYAAVGG